MPVTQMRGRIAPLRLGTGASIYQGSDDSCIPDIDPDCTYAPPPLVGDGHLRLDGEGGYAAADGPVVDTGDSFTLGVVVRLADSEPARPMTVLSQSGEHTDAFKVRYEPSTHTWQLVMPEKDEAGAPEKVVSQIVGEKSWLSKFSTTPLVSTPPEGSAEMDFLRKSK